MGSENLGRGGVVALANMMQQSPCTTLVQGRGKDCKPEWAQLLAFFFSQNVFDDAAPGPSVPALTPKCPESIEWCKILDISYSEQKRLMMRGCRSVNEGGDVYMESLCSSHAAPLMGQEVVMILSRTTGHSKSFKQAQQASWMSTAFTSWRCPGAVLLSISTETLLAWYEGCAKPYFGSGSAELVHLCDFFQVWI